MKDIKAVFRNLEKKLKHSSWFDDNWEIYNRGPYLQLYKTQWYNQSQSGIHFETFIESPQIKQKSFPICMHAEEDCPNQSEFIRQFLALESERIQCWKGYQVIGQGSSILQKNMPLNFKNIEQRIFEEMNKLRHFESSIDQVLKNL